MLQQSEIFNKTTPITFINWLEIKDKVSPDFKENYTQYQEYIREWVKINNNKGAADKNFFNSLYIDLLKEITLNFSTEEERRFVINFDYTKTENLDIILPFFIEKLKGVCLFYSRRREKLKESVTLIPYKGTNFHIQKITKNIVLDKLDDNFIQKANEGFASFPALSSISNILDVRVEEIYDSENYYNKTPTALSGTFGSVDIDPNLYLNIKQSIIDAINEYPFYLDNLYGTFSINLQLSGTELKYLKQRDFLNYINTLSSEDLKLNVKKQLFPKYASTNFYYVSVGSSLESVLSGQLFSNPPLTGSKISNLSNRDYATIATVQSFENLYTSYELGKFFTPSKTGVLQYNSFKKSYYIDYKKITPGSVYVFPDPNVIEKNEESPLTYKVDVTWNRQDIGAGFKFGDVISSKYYQRFYPYESLEQDLGKQPYGLSLSEDNVSFWGGDKDTFWTDEQLWPGLDKVEKLPLKDRFDSLLIDVGECVEWYTDVYGNEFGLYKEVEKTHSLYNKKKLLPGNLYIKNSVTNLVSTFNSFFDKILLKYPVNVQNEAKQGVYNFYVLGDIVLIETSNYVVVESYVFDFVTGEFLSNLLPGLYIPKSTINSNLEKFAGYFYVDKLEELYLCFTKLLPSLSSSNYKCIFPSIYKIRLKDFNFSQVYPKKTFDAMVYSLSSNKYREFPEIDLKYIEGGKFSYKEKFNIFNLTYCAYNYNDIPYYVNEQFSLENIDNSLISYSPLLNKPYYYVHDTNFSNPSLDTQFLFAGTYSENVGVKDETDFRWNIESQKYENFHFCSKVNPTLINLPGTHYVQFDWGQYLNGNIFIGCENVQVTLVDDKNFVLFGDKSFELIEIDTWYKIADINFKGNIFTLSAFKPFNTNNSLVKFDISSEYISASSKYIFCDDLYSLYNNVKVRVVGDGFGTVTSDPFCVECSKLPTLTSIPVSGIECNFQFPRFSSITLIPSAVKDSVFAGWIGGTCGGTAGNCLLTVSDTVTVSAVFNKIPKFTLSVTSNLPDTRIITLDGSIDCLNTVCSAEYLQGTLVGVSAGPAPIGYSFDRFRGINLDFNNPIGVTMSKNYNLTATYVSAYNTIEITNNFKNNIFGSIMGTISGAFVTEEFDLILSESSALFYLSGESNFGTIYCSVSPNNLITGYANLFVERGKSVTLSAREVEPYKFREFDGNPCGGVRSICNFLVTNNFNITGYFDLPFYTVSVYNSGNAVFYTESMDGNLNLGTLSLKNTRNKTSFSYVSGTFLTVSGVAIRGTGMLSLSAGKYGVVSSDQENGSDKLIFTFPVTETVTITSACSLGDDGYRTITLAKSGQSGNWLQSIIYTGDISGTISYSLQPAILNQTFNDAYPQFTEIEIYPTFIPQDQNFLYILGTTTFGNSSLNLYQNIIGSNLVSVENISQSPVYEEDLIYVDNSLLRLDKNNSLGNAPLFVNKFENLIRLTNNKFYNTIIKSGSAIAFFENNSITPTTEVLFNISWNTRNQTITSYIPGEASTNNANDRPRINTWRSDGTSIIYASAGNIFYDPVSKISSSPFGNRSVGNIKIPITLSGSLFCGVDVFVPTNLTPILKPDTGWTTRVNPSIPEEVIYQYLVNYTNPLPPDIYIDFT